MIQIAWVQNQHVNSLATLPSSLTKEVPRLIKVEVVAKPNIDARVNVSTVTMSEPSGWTRSLTFWPRTVCRPMRNKQREYAESLLGIGCRQTANCTRGL